MTAATPAGRARWLTRSILGVGLTSLLSDAGHEAATAALPALLTSLAAGPGALGIIEGVSDAAASFAKLGGGWLGDHPERRKPLAVAGYLVTGLSTGAYALARAWPGVLAARGLGWMARGIRGPARDAMLADGAPADARGRAFGFHRTLDSLGAVLGPLGAGFILTRSSLRAVFGWSLIPGLLSALAFAVLVRPQRAGPAHRREPLDRALGRLPPPFRRFLASALAFGIGDFARSLLILRATTLLTPRLGAGPAAAVAVTLFALHNLVYAVASYPVGWCADRVEPRRLLMLGYVLGAITAGLAAGAGPSVPVLGALFVAGGLTLAFVDTLEGVLTATLVPPAILGTGYGVLAAVNGLGDLLSSATVGVCWAAAGPAVAFGGAAALCGLGAARLWQLDSGLEAT